jgi:hypothetical protein
MAKHEEKNETPAMEAKSHSKGFLSKALKDKGKLKFGGGKSAFKKMSK